jgi:hypothetical protein
MTEKDPYDFTSDLKDEYLPEAGVPTYHRGKLFAAGFTIFVLIIVLISVFSCGPREGTILYGICKTYLEQNIPYPETIKPTNVEQYPSASRIYYTSIAPFGQFRLDQIECVYKTDAENTLQVDKVLFNRREEDPEKVKKFNVSLAAIVAGKPDLTLPEPLPDINELLENLDD